MIYVYAIAARPCQRPDDLRGLEGQPVALRESEALAAVYSEHAEAAMEPSAERLWLHETVVESLMRSCDAVLPVRFGMSFTDETALDDVLAQHGAALASGLERVRGCVEVGLRVTPRNPRAADEASATTRAEPAPSSGRAYMLARLDAERRRRGAEVDATRVAEALRTALTSMIRDAAYRTVPAPGVLLTAAYLVQRNDADALIARVRELAPQYPDLRLLCTGPWPPYHFAPALRRAEAAHA